MPAISNKRRRARVQASNVTFELHTLGWEAFQNLCGHVAQEILGQTVTIYAPTNDVGQDGAFQGKWKQKDKESFSGRFVIQCKFTASRDAHLSLGNLKDELTKAVSLAKAGRANTYLLVTNAKVTGEAETKIRDSFSAISGIDHFDIFGAEWLTRQILKSKRLRAYVPRIYGLGDLSQILDERVYRQAQEILQTWRDNLRKFVPTDAHLRSVRALLQEGFVMLLGDPMAGKSTIAAALALASADEGCSTIFVTHPQQLKENWNPDEPKQFFWVDDAFGQTQYNASRAAEWGQIFPLMFAAIRGGARVLFTSRTYIYRQAERDLKVSAFPLLRKMHVVIEVEKLTELEKQRILYNHIRLGAQPATFRRALKPHLLEIAKNHKFLPEIARRLGDPFFTEALRIESATLKQFIEEPAKVLGDIIAELDKPNFGAVALMFMRAGRVSSPLHIDEHETAPMALLGVNPAQLREAFLALEGSLVSRSLEEGNAFWKFRHPSIRDAMGASVASQPDLIDIYLTGAKPQDLLNEVVCAGIKIQGAKVHISVNRFDQLIEKLRELRIDDWSVRFSLVSFLLFRCKSEFVVRWFAACPKEFDRLFRVALGNYSFSCVLSRLQVAGVLPHHYRSAYLQSVARAAVREGDTNFLDDELRPLVTDEEAEEILQRIKRELLPSLDSKISSHEDDFTPGDDDPSDHFGDWRKNLESFVDSYEDPDIVPAFRDALDLIDEAISRLEERNTEHEEEEKRKRIEKAEQEEREREQYWEYMNDERRPSSSSSHTRAIAPGSSSSPPLAPPRSIFDDVDEM